MNNNNSKKTEKQLILFNNALEYFDRYEKKDFLNNPDEPINNSYDDENYLRDQMLEELDLLKDLILSNPDLKFDALTESEKDFFYEFVKYYSICPVCGSLNHYFNLKKIFFDETNKAIRNSLIRIMNFKVDRNNSYKLEFGIPCCKCYKKLFSDEF
ncbi:MAG: hypothetical protein GF383_00490 [Candidatus Lokiarchaeota archaeon]|nr:hypothetical protein [Candidatus Lokiarchaeota archaeon]MBD3337634.1 hypothetical protein [Candidatus Lokiarchaeota archaeon]